MISQIWLPVLWGFLFLATLVWFYLVLKLTTYLQCHHPATYVSLDRFHLFLRNTPQTGTRFLRFILNGDYKTLADPQLNRLCGSMRIFFMIYGILAMGLGPVIILTYVKMPNQPVQPTSLRSAADR